LSKSMGMNREAVVRAYANAERDGKVRRERNDNQTNAAEYAKALYRDGIIRGWQ
jgi:hypothetical protein